MNVNFKQYDSDNPDVYRMIVFFANQARLAGHSKYSMRAIMHRIRWHMNVETRDPDGFKINNNYSQDYAIKVMSENPELDGFFRLRF